jgi:hypothetical protein
MSITRYKSSRVTPGSADGQNDAAVRSAPASIAARPPQRISCSLLIMSAWVQSAAFLSDEGVAVEERQHGSMTLIPLRDSEESSMLEPAHRLETSYRGLCR